MKIQLIQNIKITNYTEIGRAAGNYTFYPIGFLFIDIIMVWYILYELEHTATYWKNKVVLSERHDARFLLRNGRQDNWECIIFYKTYAAVVLDSRVFMLMLKASRRLSKNHRINVSRILS